MNDIIKSLSELLNGLGVTNDYIRWTILLLSLSSFLIAVVTFLWKIINKIISVRNQKLLNEDLKPFFTPEDVQRATKYFIPTMGQNVSPSEDDEPGRTYITATKNKLIPLFLRKVFNNAGASNKYYMVLADTGMGKTTFLINLLLKYRNQWRYFVGLSKGRKIVLYPLGDPRVLEIVSNLPDKYDTILLLDAFDEDIAALDDHQERMVEILKRTQEFRTVVITCRTQFFPSEEEEPHKTGYFSFGGSGEYKFQKLYLSVFDDSDVKRYLRRRFSLFSISSYFKAKSIVKKCPNLVVRPMLLSHVKDLIGSDSPFDYSFQIYEVMIMKWIEREAEKPGIQQKYGDSDEYQKLLYQFSSALAVDMYENKDRRGGYLITRDEKISLHSQIQITDIESEYKELALTEKEARSQSLLNRNSKGQYKYSHKSFMEYFLARELIDIPEFYWSFDFNGMSAAKMFFDEMLVAELSTHPGTYRLRSKRQDLTLTNLRPDEILQVYIMEVFDVGGLRLVTLSAFKKLADLTLWNDQRFPYLYEIYRYLLWYGWTMWKEFGPNQIPPWLLNMKPQDPIEWLEGFKAVTALLNTSGLSQLFSHLGVNPSGVIERLTFLVALKFRWTDTGEKVTVQFRKGMTEFKHEGDMDHVTLMLYNNLQSQFQVNHPLTTRVMEAMFNSGQEPPSGTLKKILSIPHIESGQIEEYFREARALQGLLRSCHIHY